MAQNINSLQLLRNTVLFGSKDLAVSGITSAATNDGTVKLARYEEDGKVKTIFGIYYKAETAKTGSYTIYDSPKEVIAALEGRVKANEDAITKLNGANTVEGSVAKSIKDAIEALDANEVGGTGKVITTISETDGKISATAIDLTAANVAAIAISGETDKVDVDGTTVAAQIGSLAKSIKTAVADAKSYSVKKLSAEEVTALGDSNVREAYQLLDEDSHVSGETIKIYKDSSLKEVNLVGQELKFTYILADGSENTVGVDVSTFLAESEFKNGLEVVGGVVNVKVDAQSESFLTVGENGVKLSGVQDAINGAVGTAISGLDATVSAETAHVSVTVKQVDGALTEVALTEADIASASALTTETSAREAEDAKIVAGVGFATKDNAYVISANTGNNKSLSAESYTVANALYTLDDAIAAAKNANTLKAEDNTVVVGSNEQGNTTVKVNIATAATVSNFVGYAKDGSFVKSAMFEGIDAGTY